MSDPKRTQCMQCMSWGDPSEYHPYTFCALVQAGHSPELARVHINSVLDWGRRLERLKLPNNAPLRDVTDDPPIGAMIADANLSKATPPSDAARDGVEAPRAGTNPNSALKEQKHG